MRTSENITKLAAALLKAQKAITFAAKESTNPHFKSKYADLPAVIDAVKPALNENGIAFIQTTGTSDPGILAMTTRLLHESGEWLEDTATCPLPKNDPQGYGSACTYLRRYSLASAVGLYQDDDDGQAASKPKPHITPTAGTWEELTDEQRSAIQTMVDCIRSEFDQKGAEAAAHLWTDETKDFSVEEKTAAWTRFDSKERSAMKKASQLKAA